MMNEEELKLKLFCAGFTAGLLFMNSKAIDLGTAKPDTDLLKLLKELRELYESDPKILQLVVLIQAPEIYKKYQELLGPDKDEEIH